MLIKMQFLSMNVHFPPGRTSPSLEKKRVMKHDHQSSVENYVEELTNNKTPSKKIAIVGKLQAQYGIQTHADLITVSAGEQTRREARTAVLKRKLSGPKSQQQDPERQTLVNTNVGHSEIRGSAKVDGDGRKIYEGTFDLELYEHDFQPFDTDN